MQSDDRAQVERQIGRAPRAFRRVAVRCPFGLPAVTEQSPYDSAGEPFPTTYYLTCRHLVTAVSRLEAVGGVERWSEAVQADGELRSSLAAATVRQRKIRRALAGDALRRDGGRSLELGIAGSSDEGRLKCLHAHVAFGLVHSDYLVARRILSELDPLWPEHGCCSR